MRRGGCWQGERSSAWGGLCLRQVAERGGASQKSEAAGQEGQAMTPRVGVEREEVQVAWTWSQTLCRG